MTRYPQDIQRKIKDNEEKISTLSTSELLEYSKSLYKLELENDITDHLFNKIDERRKFLNSRSERVLKCKDSEMIKKFKNKDKRWNM